MARPGRPRKKKNKGKKRPGRLARAKARAQQFGGKQWGKISNIVGGVVFLAQITSKDRSAYTGKSKGEQLKQLANNVLGRTLGINPFDEPGMEKFEQTINFDGIFNKYTGAGVAGIIYGSIPIRGLPHKAKVKRMSKSVLTGGILGGLFDAPENDTRNRVVAQRSNPSLIQSQVQGSTLS